MTVWQHKLFFKPFLKGVGFKKKIQKRKPGSSFKIYALTRRNVLFKGSSLCRPYPLPPSQATLPSRWPPPFIPRKGSSETFNGAAERDLELQAPSGWLCIQCFLYYNSCHSAHFSLALGPPALLSWRFKTLYVPFLDTRTALLLRPPSHPTPPCCPRRRGAGGWQAHDPSRSV